jgi:hypothetical protein
MLHIRYKKMNIGQYVGLTFLVIGTLLLAYWGFDMAKHGSVVTPGIILAGAGVVIMYLSGQSHSGNGN